MTRRLLVLGAGTAGTMIVNKLRRRLRRARVGHHGRRPRRRPPLPAGLPASCPSAATPPTRSPGPAHALLPTASSSSSATSTGSTAAANTVALDRRPHAWPTTTSSSPPAPRRGRTRRPACWARSGGAASSTSTPSKAPTPWPPRCENFDHGRLVVHVTDMPIKCPVAPLEFTFLAEAWLREKGLRDRVELVYVTPLPGAFTKPVASDRLGVDARRAQDPPSSRTSWSSASTSRPRRWCRTTSARCRSTCWSRSRSTWAPTSSRARGSGTSSTTCRSTSTRCSRRRSPNIFAVGDASDIPTSKAGSVAHFSVEVFVDNFLAAHRRAGR